jgi:CRP-like cAMP-binding protein
MGVIGHTSQSSGRVAHKETASPNLGAKDCFDVTAWSSTEGSPHTLATIQSHFGERQQFKRDAEIYPQGSQPKHWYLVVSGTVRLTTLLADGHRHIGNFSLPGDCFGLEAEDTRQFAAEAVTECFLHRCPLQTTGQLIKNLPQIAQQLWNLNLKALAATRSHAVTLGRMTAPMRVASFLLHFSGRQGSTTLIDLPMSRGDVADYLGLTIETLCRVLSRFVEIRLITIFDPNHIEIIDRCALETICLNGFDPGLGHYYVTQRRRSG